MRTSFEIVAVELFVGRWILFGLRQRMAISSAIAAARMSAVQVCARAAPPPLRPGQPPPRASPTKICHNFLKWPSLRHYTLITALHTFAMEGHDRFKFLIQGCSSFLTTNVELFKSLIISAPLRCMYLPSQKALGNENLGSIIRHLHTVNGVVLSDDEQSEFISKWLSIYL